MYNRKDKLGSASGKEADILRTVGFGADFQGTVFLEWGLGKAHQDPGVRLSSPVTSLSLLSHFCKQGDLVGPTP